MGEVHIDPSELGLDQKRQTPWALKNESKLWLNMFGKLNVEGQKNLNAVSEIRKNEPDAKFIIAGSHFSHLDVPAAVTALGDDFDIQVTAESVLFERGRPEREFLMRLSGSENYSPITYQEDKSGKRPVFDPENFTAIADRMEEGKTPWMAIHEFNYEENRLGDERVGPVYLAHLSGESYILPTALEVKGANPDLANPVEQAKALGRRLTGSKKTAEATFHIGQPIKLEPLDVSPISRLIELRKQKIKPTPEEVQAFRDTHKRLKEQAGEVAQAIAAMLPEEQRAEKK